MKLKENIYVRKIGNEYMIASDSPKGIDFSHVTSLNETSAFLIEKTESIITEDAWVNLLLDEYDVDETTAREDVRKLIEELKKIGIITE